MSRNIILVSVDSLRADRCFPAGLDRQLTPSIETLGSEGVVFRNAVAPGPNTPSSMPAVMTGSHIYGVDQGVAMRGAISNHLKRFRPIAERVAEQGYETIGYTPNPFTSRYFGFDKGFDDFTDFLSSRNRLRNRVVSRWTEGRFIAGLRLGLNMLGYGDLSISWEDYYSDLLTSIRDADEPFFLWVFLLEPHWPYYPPSRFRGETSLPEMFYHNWKRSKLSKDTLDTDGSKRLLSLYDGTVRHVDEFVGRLVEDTKAVNPVIVFHSDHGEAFGEHGQFGHGQYLYEENIHVPFIIGNVGVSEQIDAPISLRSIPEIITQIAETDRIENRKFTDWFVPAFAANKTAIRGRDWKFIAEPNQNEFFDLRSNPAGISSSKADICQPLAELYDQLLSDRDEKKRIGEACQGLTLSPL